MNAVLPPGLPPLPSIPENAPFSLEQRAWLNGFLAGLYGNPGATTPMTLSPGAAPEPEEDFPWHDPALELDERMKLAEGKPLKRRLMAAMAQLDCGQCGYLCQTYSEALAEGREATTTLCVPGAKATSRMVKQLLAEAPAIAASAVPKAPAEPEGVPVTVLSAEPLTTPDSAKDVRHVVIDLGVPGLTYLPGDSINLTVHNDPALIQATIAALGAKPETVVTGADGKDRTLAEAFDVLDIARPLDRTLDLLAGAAAYPAHAAALRKLVEGDDGAEPDGFDLLDLLQAFPSARPPLGDLVRSLPPLRKRLYSIASSPLAHAGQVHLCVSVVKDMRRSRARLGVGSGFLGFRAVGGGSILASIQTSHFRLPDDPKTPVIMVGPGTGIAPFRSFLAERSAAGIKGRSWLFFGDQHEASDFLYRDTLRGWLSDGTLGRLDVAFSRDQAAKVYVQHRMAEQAADLWRWLQEGAHFYVCGDAMRMARDVDAALRRIAMTEGGLSEDQAREWIVALARQGRYLRDIY
ncbi:MAG TPA: sulfite reductase subunit alpha [Rhodopila sp.]|uniref:sulfite reductase subunit alpha n=1 Tax=Rhodopila sp. TaxID=2480087 RepID=UPI002B880529|nr:sulfite reductase subunit alpha [Rhodopila sp.]HVY13824.1 sulfite reductase subunit alpha [Rhodopila sp.]